MTENRFPPGWDDKKVREVIAYYDSQTEEEAIAEAEAAFENKTMMEIPTELVPFVRGLIGLRQVPPPVVEIRTTSKSSRGKTRRA